MKTNFKEEFYFLIKIFCLVLFDRKGRDRIPPIHGSSNACNIQARTRLKTAVSGLHHGWQHQKYLSHHLLLPRSVRIPRKPGQKWRCQDLNQALWCQLQEYQEAVECYAYCPTLNISFSSSNMWETQNVAKCCSEKLVELCRNNGFYVVTSAVLLPHRPERQMTRSWIPVNFQHYRYFICCATIIV